jgi:hypothetical protein
MKPGLLNPVLQPFDDQESSNTNGGKSFGDRTARINILNKYKSTPLSTQRVAEGPAALGDTNQSVYVLLDKEKAI